MKFFQKSPIFLESIVFESNIVLVRLLKRMQIREKGKKLKTTENMKDLARLCSNFKSYSYEKICVLPKLTS